MYSGNDASSDDTADRNNNLATTTARTRLSIKGQCLFYVAPTQCNFLKANSLYVMTTPQIMQLNKSAIIMQVNTVFH